MRCLFFSLVALPLLAHAQSAPTDEPKKRDKAIIGISTGVFLPFDADVRRALNSTNLQIPLPGPMNTERFKDRTFRFNFNLVNGSNGDNRLFAPSLLYGYEIRFRGLDPANSVTYARFDAGVAYLDYALDIDGRRVAAKRFSPAGAIEVGTIIRRKVRLSATYNGFGSYDGINLSGLTLGIQFAVARF